SPPQLAILRPHLKCSLLLTSEIFAVLRKYCPFSGPGPDSIPYSAWKVVHFTAPRLLTDLLSPLLSVRYHPALLKKANGVVLDMSGKPCYEFPSAFDIIISSQTISKIEEQIVVYSLAVEAR